MHQGLLETDDTFGKELILKGREVGARREREMGGGNYVIFPC